MWIDFNKFATWGIAFSLSGKKEYKIKIEGIMRDIEEIKALIWILGKKTECKNLLDLAIYITNYYFHFNFDVEHTDKKLLKKMMLLFMLDISMYLWYPRRKPKSAELILKDIDKELYEYKKIIFNEWLFKNLPLTEKQIEEKRKSLRL